MAFPAKLARETRTLADHLQSVPSGGETSYANISRLVGLDICTKRHCLYAARRLALAESGALFDTVRNKGLRRLIAEEIPSLGSAARKRMRLTARRAGGAMNKAMSRLNDVDPVVRRQHMAESAILGLVGMIAADRTVRKLEQRADPLPVADTARVLLRLIGAS